MSETKPSLPDYPNEMSTASPVSPNHRESVPANPSHPGEFEFSGDIPPVALPRKRSTSLQAPAKAKAWLITFLISFSTLLPAFLGGGTESWSKAIVFMIWGGIMILEPSKLNPARHLWICIGALILVHATAFLPVSWFGEADWRGALRGDLKVPLGILYSPQPWISLENLLEIVILCFWFHYLVARVWTDAERKAALGMVSVGIAALAILAWWEKSAVTRFEMWRYLEVENHWGPFPNRNHFASLIAAGTVVSIGLFLQSARKFSLWAILWLPCSAIGCKLLVDISSRGGVIVALFGFLVLLFLNGVQSGSKRKLATAVSTILIIGVLTYFFGRPLLDKISQRFTYEGSLEQTIQTEGRIPIFHDSIRILSKAPLFGQGLGNFEGVFSVNREIASESKRYLHPESDYMWLTFEGGMAALIAAGSLVWALRKRFYFASSKLKKKDQAIRVIALSGLSVFAVHGIFDVPWHVLGTCAPALLLLSLSLSQRERRADLPISKMLCVGRGAIVLSLGILLSALAAGKLILPSKTSAGYLGQQATRFAQEGSLRDAYQLYSQAIEWEPLEWNWRFLRGMTLGTAQSVPQALRDFRVARRLERHSSRLPLAEAALWQQTQPAYALAAVAEAMRRDPLRAHESFSNFAPTILSLDSELREQARTICLDYPQTRVLWLQQYSKENFSKDLEAILYLDPKLSDFTPNQRSQILQAWAENLGIESLQNAIKTYPEWAPFAWRAIAQDAARQARFDVASNLALKNLPPPSTLPNIGSLNLTELTRSSLLNPTDLYQAELLYVAQKKEQKIAEAMATLKRIQQLHGNPPWLLYELGFIEHRLGNFKNAWEYFSQYTPDTKF